MCCLWPHTALPSFSQWILGEVSFCVDVLLNHRHIHFWELPELHINYLWLAGFLPPPPRAERQWEGWRPVALPPSSVRLRMERGCLMVSSHLPDHYLFHSGRSRKLNTRQRTLAAPREKHVFKSWICHLGGSEALLSEVRMNNHLTVIHQPLLLSPATSSIIPQWATEEVQ